MKNNFLKEVMELTIQGHKIKMYGSLENPIFLANDISKLIDYSVGTTLDMLSKVRSSEKLFADIRISGQTNSKPAVTINGLYEILMSSGKPIAQEFKIYVESLLNGLGSTPIETLEIIDKGITALKETGKCVIDETIIHADENLYLKGFKDGISTAEQMIIKNNKKIIIIAGVAIILTVGGYIGYKIYKKRKERKNSNEK